MKSLKIGNKEILLVPVGEGDNIFVIEGNIIFWIDEEGLDDNCVYLPSDGWRILGSGKADAITEEEWKEVVQVDNWRDGGYKTGISVQSATKGLVTGCPHCNHSYCD